MQIQMSPRSCEKTLAQAKADGLYTPRSNIRRGVQIMAMWRDWVERNEMNHNWLLNYNQGYGHCQKKGRRCDNKGRVPVDTGYADRVLLIYKRLRRVQEVIRGRLKSKRNFNS
jgi:hypothetical protein